MKAFVQSSLTLLFKGSAESMMKKSLA